MSNLVVNKRQFLQETMNKDVRIQTGGLELIDRVQPLWEKLKCHHLEMAGALAGGITGWDFQARKEGLQAKGCSHFIELATDKQNCHDVLGYCISTIDHAGMGEIDSVYIAECHRRRGLATALIQRALAWMDREAVQGRRVSVMAMNEPARKLYEHFGFVIRLLEMEVPSEQSHGKST